MAKELFSKLTKTKFSTKTNIVANFLGNAILTASSIIFVPIYLSYLGIEAYGLIGFFASFQTILLVLDLGISLTLTRELAVRDGVEEKAQESRNLVRTFEIIYWGIAVVLGILSFILVPVLTIWVNPNELSTETIQSSFYILSFALVLQFPITFYMCGLTGLQKQVLSSIITIFFSIFRYVGAWMVLQFVSSTPQSFFIWQVISSGFQVMVMGIALWCILPKVVGKTKFQKDLVTDIWQFISGMGGINIVSVLLMQFDKIILVYYLPLKTFGYYAIAGLVATSLYRIVYPIFLAFYPKLSQISEQSDDEVLTKTYHQGCQVMSVIILPIAMMLIFFAEEIMFLWQQNAETARQTALLVSLMTIGYTLHSLIFIPHALQLAKSWTNLYFYTLLIALFVSVPAVIFTALCFDAIAVTIVLIVIFASFILLMIPLMHRRLLQNEMWKWYFQDVGLPLFTVALIGLIGRSLFVDSASQIIVISQLGVIIGISFLLTILITPYSRKWIVGQISPNLNWQ